MPESAEYPTGVLIERLLDAVSRGDAEGLRAVIDPSITIHTARGEIEGVDAASEWVGKGFDHLDRRFRLLDFTPTDQGARARAVLEYVWRESDEVADSTEVEIEIGLLGGRVTSWRVVE